MRLGVTFPHLEIGTDVGLIREYLQTAQDLGYDYFLAYDHVLGADPANRPGWEGYTHQSLFHEIFVLFGFAAAVAPKLELVPGIVILPQRQTVLVAKQAAEVDVLTEGKFRLGVGIGWNPVEFEGLGETYGNRAVRIEEQVDLLRRLFTEPVLTYQGQFHTITEAGLNPLPVQRPIPIWFGGMADPVLRRIARIGDGWFPLGKLDDEMLALIATLRQHTVEAGRPVEAVGIDARVDCKQIPEAEWAAETERWRAAGATHLSINSMGRGWTPKEHIAAIQRFKRAVS